MAWLMLALALVAQEPASEKDVDDLVARLSSEEVQEREKAQSKLYALGPSIKARLEALLGDALPEAAARIRAVLDRFEWEEHFRESLPPVARVTLDRGRRTPEEIFALIRERTGWRIRAAAMNLRETVELGRTEAPALQVIDDVCRALGRGRVHLRVIAGSPQGHPSRAGRAMPDEGRLISIDGNLPLAPAVAYWNQFRAEVADIVITETRDYTSTRRHAVIHLWLAAQPGSEVLRAGS